MTTSVRNDVPTTGPADTAGPGPTAPAGVSGAPAPPRVEAARTSGILGRLVALAVVVLLVGQVAVAWLAVDGFERELKPQLSSKAEVVGHAVSDQLGFAVNDLRIPAGELVGVDSFLDNVLADNPDIQYLLLLDDSSNLLSAHGLTPDTLEAVLRELPPPGAEAGTMTEVSGFTDGAFPITLGGQVAAVLHVGISRDYVQGRLSELFFEAMTVIVVSLLVTLEFLIFFMNVRIAGPLERIEALLTDGARGMFANRVALRARDEIGELVAAFNRTLRSLCQRYEDFRFDAREIEDAQIDRDIAQRIREACARVDSRFHFSGGAELRPRNAMQIRIPLFLFMFAEELPRSFLPLFVARLSPSSGMGLSDEVLIGLPITLFMLAAAIMIPSGGRIADRLGARRVFLAGLVPAAAGYVGTFLADQYFELIAWRVLSGIGYGLIFIAAQAWVAEHTSEGNRAQGMSVFVGGVFAATICGPSIGGILAGRIGFEATFLVSAGLAVASGLIVYFMLEGVGARKRPGPLELGKGQWRVLFSDRRLFAVSFLAAVPGKLILSGFLFYLVPLYLSELGNRQAVIGWMIMLYGVSTIVCMSFASRFADRSGRHSAVVTAGGALAGLGCLASLFETTIGPSNAVAVAIVALGIGHALSLTSQLAIVQNEAHQHRDRLGQASAIGAYRVVERAGMVLGPIIAGAFAAAFGYQGAIVGIGLIVLACIALYAVVMGLPGQRGAVPDLRRGEAA